MDQLLILLGTISGAVVGAAGTWLVQRDTYRQQSRDQQRDTQRAVILQWLVAGHRLYLAERAAQSQLAQDGDRISYAAAFDGAPVAEALAALEELRLVCDTKIQEAAESMWHHLREEAARFREADPPMTARKWTEIYYARKQLLTKLARETLNRQRY